MGPTNVALVKLYRANEALREAQDRLDAASKNVRVQERKVNDLIEGSNSLTLNFGNCSPKAASSSWT